MRNHLNRRTQVITSTLSGNNISIDLASGEVVFPAHGGTNKTFVVPQIQICFGTVGGHKYFTVLQRTHGAWVDVDIGVELEHGDFQPAGFKNGT